MAAYVRLLTDWIDGIFGDGACNKLLGPKTCLLYTSHGRDDGPGTEEWNAINREMLDKLRELRRKYAPPSKPLE